MIIRSNATPLFVHYNMYVEQFGLFALIFRSNISGEMCRYVFITVVLKFSKNYYLTVCGKFWHILEFRGRVKNC